MYVYGDFFLCMFPFFLKNQSKYFGISVSSILTV